MAGLRRCVCVLSLLGAWLGVGAAAWAGEPDPTLLMVRGSAACGDGLVQANEACDDGNLALGDGCSATCRLELRFTPDADHDGISDDDERLLGTRHDAADSDGDGLCDGLDAVPGVCYVGEGATLGQDSDNDGALDALEADDDHDGIATSVEVALTLAQGRFDPDCDGLPNWADADSDADGLTDGAEGLEDADGDGLSAFLDTYPSDGPLGDMDGDGLTHAQEARLGTRPMSPDSDFDGILDGVEAPQGLALDADGDGTPDALDTDSDNDSALDRAEGTLDRNWNKLPDYRDLGVQGDRVLSAAQDPIPVR